ncbi:hypothetical protein [Echinicola arenosa]|nr:hypothetical protein [Echinicola arenosa]
MFLIFTGFLLSLLIFNHGEIIQSAKITFSIIVTVSMLLVGRHVGQTTNFIEEFEPYNRFMLALIPVYVIYANIFNVGYSYSASFTDGFLTHSRMYIAPILIFMGIQYILEERERSTFIKIVDAIIIGVNIAILIVITRRTSIGMIVVAILIYCAFNTKVIFKMAMILFFMATILVLAYPLYEKPLREQMAERERIQNLETYENEGRVRETIFLWDHHNREQSAMELFFGVQLFDTESFGVRYFGIPRPIHSDINMIIYSTGLVGFLIFFAFFSYYLLLGNNSISKPNRKIFYPLLAMFLVVLLPGRFIGTFTFGPLLMLLLTATKHGRKYKLKKRVKLKKTRYRQLVPPVPHEKTVAKSLSN